MYFSLCESLLENSLTDLFFMDSNLNNWLYSTPSSYYTYSICSCGKSSSSSSFKFNPNINLSEDDHHYYIHVDLPGMTKDQITLDLNQEDRILTISGERIAPNTNENNNNNDSDDKNENENENEDNNVKDNNNTTDNDIASTSTSTSTSSNNKEKKSQENDKRKYIQKESHYGTFSRSFSLPENIHFDNIQANMENGVLRIMMAKLESPKSKSRLIQIE